VSLCLNPAVTSTPNSVLVIPRLLPAIAVMVVIAIAIVVVIVVALMPVVVPFMIVLDPATGPFPVPLIELSAFISRHYPASPAIRCACVIPVVPLPTISYGVPITCDPNELRSRAARNDPNHARRRGRSDSDSDGNLCARSRQAN
jgi:hypothetical protein